MNSRSVNLSIGWLTMFMCTFFSDFSRNQCWRCEEASGCRDIHLQWLDDAHQEGLVYILNF